MSLSSLEAGLVPPELRAICLVLNHIDESSYSWCSHGQPPEAAKICFCPGDHTSSWHGLNIHSEGRTVSFLLFLVIASVRAGFYAVAKVQALFWCIFSSAVSTVSLQPRKKEWCWQRFQKVRHPDIYIRYIPRAREWARERERWEPRMTTGRFWSTAESAHFVRMRIALRRTEYNLRWGTPTLWRTGKTLLAYISNQILEEDRTEVRFQKLEAAWLRDWALLHSLQHRQTRQS